MWGRTLKDSASCSSFDELTDLGEIRRNDCAVRLTNLTVSERMATMDLFNLVDDLLDERDCESKESNVSILDRSASTFFST